MPRFHFRGHAVPLPVLLLLIANLVPAITGFWKLPGILRAAGGYAPLEAAVLLAGFLAGWLFHFVVLAALLARKRYSFALCACGFLLLALLSLLVRAYSGGFFTFFIQFGLLALPSSRTYLGFEPDA